MRATLRSIGIAVLILTACAFLQNTGLGAVDRKAEEGQPTAAARTGGFDPGAGEAPSVATRPSPGGAESAGDESSMKVDIQRLEATNQLLLFVHGALHARATSSGENSTATAFRLRVYPDLASADREAGETHDDESLFYGEVRLGRKISTRGGFTTSDFLIQKGEGGSSTLRPNGSLAILVNVPDAQAAIVRVKQGAASPEDAIPEFEELPADAAGPETPAVTAFMGPRPNPAGDVISFRFSLSHRLPAQFLVFDIGGRHVATPLNRVLGAGVHEVTWDGRDDQGNYAGSGVYFVRFAAERKQFTRRFVMVR